MVANHARDHGKAGVEKYSGNPEAVETTLQAKGVLPIQCTALDQKFEGVAALINRAGSPNGLRKRCGRVLSK